ncbi:MAG: 2-C-methyl-D-erythritol 4-phosphate cytidylyltransferase [Puniceicoccales bacterium]|jgi:2-C-methyl-D-erythritol 4-phosphate cytidylyltransferase|nr:2-C-methyl-D-erythritol 4-phosphate cytidylyltransferase [Puniceicoccales bacterium]
MQRYAIILMAGRSRRFGGEDKCLATVDSKPIVSYSFEAFRKTKIFDRYFFVYRDATQRERLETFFKNHYLAETLSHIVWVSGGQERALSVYAALEAIHEQFSTEAFIFIHDGARPLVTAEHILGMNALLSPKWGIVLGHRSTDTMVTIVPKSDNATVKNSDSRGTKDPVQNMLPIVEATEMTQRHYPIREMLWSLETPQTFYFPAIFEDYKAAIHLGRHPTDDSSVFSGTIKFFENNNLNLKITTAQDLEFLRAVFNISDSIQIQ